MAFDIKRAREIGLAKEEIAALRPLSSPEKIQDYITAMPSNWETNGDSCYSARLALRHGSQVETVLGDAREIADLGTDFGGGLYEREVEHFVGEEWALTVDDVIWRRSKAGLHMPSGTTAALAEYLARRIGAPGRLTPADAERRYRSLRRAPAGQ